MHHQAQTALGSLIYSLEGMDFEVRVNSLNNFKTPNPYVGSWIYNMDLTTLMSTLYMC